MSEATDAAGGPDEARLARERDFHDDLARELDPEAMGPEEPGRMEAAMFARAAVRPGMHVLDLGCGQGDLSLHLALQGVRVTGLDLSPGMVEVARRRCAHFAPQATTRFVAAPVEATGLEDDAFDAIVGRFILHHLDVPQAAPEIARILKPGASAVLIENTANNRLLIWARDKVTGRAGIPRLGTDDEHPLRDADVDALRPYFAGVELDYPVFEFLRLFDRQVLRFRSPAASRACLALDGAVERRVPRLRRYSYRVQVTLTA